MNPNPGGLCMCGCGQATPLARWTDRRTGLVKGQPVRFVPGHQSRLAPVEYLKADCGYDTPCWVWQLAKDRKGYGQLRVGGRLRRAPRVYYEREFGTIPEGLQIDHLCENKACVNPHHLEAVTGTVNIRRSPATLLSTASVAQIKARLAGGESGASLGREFGVTKYTISDIKRGRTWKDVGV